MSKDSLNFYLFRLYAFTDRHRSVASFMIILTIIVVSDFVFHHFLFDPYVKFIEYFTGPLSGVGITDDAVDIGYAPEVWQALLGMVLGTLILVISIASQSIPKLIDLYMKDMASLLYIWLLIISGSHAVLTKLYAELELVRPSSRIFNAHFLISICAILAFPYIFYILRYTKPNNIVNRIYYNNLKLIRSLATPRLHALMAKPAIREQIQFDLFEAMNQLDDILEFATFKELKADIIHDISLAMCEYIDLKTQIHLDFFGVTPRARSDISFKTMIGQFSEMEKKPNIL